MSVINYLIRGRFWCQVFLPALPDPVILRHHDISAKLGQLSDPNVVDDVHSDPRDRVTCGGKAAMHCGIIVRTTSGAQNCVETSKFPT